MCFRTNQSLHKVISSALRISYDTTGLPCSRTQECASDFLTKNTMVSWTIWNIVNPKNTEEFPMVRDSFKIYDLPSAWVLVRTLFEGYVNMNYLLIDRVSNEERKFRLDFWDRHALLERKKMAIFIGSQHKKLEADKKQSDEYTESIRDSKYFKALPPSKQQSFMHMDGWTDTGTIQRADKADIHRSQSEFIFKFCSNYAHSESYALMQIHAVRSTEEAQRLRRLPTSFTEMFLSLTLRLFAKLQPAAESMVEGDQDLVRIIDFWESLKTKNLKQLLTKNVIASGT